ncbi:MASE1 domain-containing protein [Hyalangium rubrum]|uniref:histidine kinase n=1 Tax=Hyalangium rubrum TaxID=3103134 RepID=A0ABU5HDQ1_9BACT|nr:MASE1 domain-containing protein [Hyalangium sp. s54d21]MDY7231391.1 MASE1 domain-containing protein [Hyalangium sp. s54d21]
MTSTESAFPRWHPLARLALFAVLYAAAVRLGRFFSAEVDQPTSVWLPSGVLLASLLLSPRRHWPALLLAAILLEPPVFLPEHPWRLSNLIVASSNALESLIGALLLRRFAGPQPEPHRVRDLLGLLVLCALLSPALNATLSLTALTFLGESSWDTYGYHWRVFWLGDAMGVLVVTPLLLSWRRGLEGWSRWRVAELVALLVALSVATHLVFGGLPGPTGSVFHPLGYLAFPFIFWAAVRFEARGASAATMLLSLIAIWHTSQGWGPFATLAAVASSHYLAFLQSFLGTASLSGLLLSAALGERRRAQLEVCALNEELRHSLEVLAKTQAELVERERLAALGELSATVAHEVRNPLAVIANCVSALRHLLGGKPNPEESSLLDIVTEEVHRLDELVHGLLDFARPVKPRPRPEPLDLLVEGALSAALRAQRSEERVKVRREVAAGLPLALVDTQLLHVALTNLFTNALQAMPEAGTLTVKLSAEVYAGAGRLQLSISDTGPGMLPEVQARIFEPFFTTRATGTGLGLPIVRRIIESHQGTVQVHSARDQGTTFTLSLPCAAPSRPQLAAG